MRVWGGGADAGLLAGPPCALWGKGGPLFCVYKIGITAKRDVLERFRDEMEAGLSVSVLQTWRCSARARA